MSVTSTGWDVVRGNSELEQASLGAELLARAIDDAVRTRGRAFVAISGGSTPGPIYRKITEYDLPLDRVDPARVHRMPAYTPDLESAALQYERLLRKTFGVANAVAFDALTLGIGDDGHTASLFPGTGAVSIDDRLVAAIAAQPSRGIEARVTLTAPVLCAARFVLVLARGIQKRAPVSAAFLDGPEDAIPARLLQRAHGKITWLFDQHVQDVS
jgi:6-phosphogluconolactonase